MKAHHLLATIVIGLGSSTAMSQEAARDVWSKFDEITLPAPRSRAEVLAELTIYQRSGLAELERGEAIDAFSQRHLVSSARYAAMRSSPEFTSLVQTISQSLGERVDVAASATAR